MRSPPQNRKKNKCFFKVAGTDYNFLFYYTLSITITTLFIHPSPPIFRKKMSQCEVAETAPTAPTAETAPTAPTAETKVGVPGTYTEERGAVTLLLERKRVKQSDIDPKNEDPEVVARIRTWKHAVYYFFELNDYGGLEETHAEIIQLGSPTPLKETDMLTEYFQYTLKSLCGGGGNLYHLFSSNGGENRKTEPRREKLKILFDYIDESGLAKHLVIFKDYPYVQPLHYCDKKVNPFFDCAWPPRRLDILGVLDAISRDEYPWNVNHESTGVEVEVPKEVEVELPAKKKRKNMK